MTGGILQLVAIGMDNIYINGTPEITLFKSVYRRIVNFSLYEHEIKVKSSISNKQTIQIPKNGDLLHKLYFLPDIPNISLKNYNPTYNNISKILADYGIIWTVTTTDLEKIVTLSIYNETIVPLINKKIQEIVDMYNFSNNGKIIMSDFDILIKSSLQLVDRITESVKKIFLFYNSDTNIGGIEGEQYIQQLINTQKQTILNGVIGSMIISSKMLSKYSTEYRAYESLKYLPKISTNTYTIATNKEDIKEDIELYTQDMRNGYNNISDLLSNTGHSIDMLISYYIDSLLMNYNNPLMKGRFYTNNTKFKDFDSLYKNKQDVQKLTDDIIPYLLYNSDDIKQITYISYLNNLIRIHNTIPPNELLYSYNTLFPTMDDRYATLLHPQITFIDETFIIYHLFDKTTNIYTVKNADITKNLKQYFDENIKTLFEIFTKYNYFFKINTRKLYKTYDSYKIYEYYINNFINNNTGNTLVTTTSQIQAQADTIKLNIDYNMRINFILLSNIVKNIIGSQTFSSSNHYRMSFYKQYSKNLLTNVYTPTSVIKGNIHNHINDDTDDNFESVINNNTPTLPTGVLNMYGTILRNSVSAFETNSINFVNGININSYTDQFSLLERGMFITTSKIREIYDNFKSSSHPTSSSLFSSEYNRMVIMNYLPLLVARDIPVMIYDIFSSYSYTQQLFTDAGITGSYADFIGTTNGIDLRDNGDDGVVQTNASYITTKTNIYQKIINNCIVSFDTTLVDDSHFKQLCNLYAPTESSYLLLYTIRREEFFPQYSSIDISGNLSDPILGLISYELEKTYLPLEWLTQTYFKYYKSKIIVLIDGYSTSTQNKNLLKNKLIGLLSDIINCYILHNTTIPEYTSYINNNYTLLGLNTETNVIFNEYKINSTPVVVTSIKYSDSLSSIWFQTQKQHVQEFNKIFNDTIFSKSYFEGTFGKAMSQMFTFARFNLGGIYDSYNSTSTALLANEIFTGGFVLTSSPTTTRNTIKILIITDKKFSELNVLSYNSVNGYTTFNLIPASVSIYESFDTLYIYEAEYDIPDEDTMYRVQLTNGTEDQNILSMWTFLRSTNDNYFDNVQNKVPKRIYDSIDNSLHLLPTGLSTNINNEGDNIKILDTYVQIINKNNIEHQFIPSFSTSISNIIGFSFSIEEYGVNTAIGFGSDGSNSTLYKIQLTKDNILIYYNSIIPSIITYINNPTFLSSDVYYCFQDNIDDKFIIYENGVLIGEVTTINSTYNNLLTKLKTNINLHISNSFTIKIYTSKYSYDNVPPIVKNYINKTNLWLYVGTTDFLEVYQPIDKIGFDIYRIKPVVLQITELNNIINNSLSLITVVRDNYDNNSSILQLKNDINLQYIDNNIVKTRNTNEYYYESSFNINTYIKDHMNTKYVNKSSNIVSTVYNKIITIEDLYTVTDSIYNSHNKTNFFRGNIETITKMLNLNLPINKVKTDYITNDLNPYYSSGLYDWFIRLSSQSDTLGYSYKNDMNEVIPLDLFTYETPERIYEIFDKILFEQNMNITNEQEISYDKHTSIVNNSSVQNGTIDISESEAYGKFVSTTAEAHQFSPEFSTTSSDIIGFAFSIVTSPINLDIGISTNGLSSNYGVVIRKVGSDYTLISNNGSIVTTEFLPKNPALDYVPAQTSISTNYLTPNFSVAENIYYCFQDNKNKMFLVFENDRLIGQVTNLHNEYNSTNITNTNTVYDNLLTYFNSNVNLYVNDTTTTAIIKYYSMTYLYGIQKSSIIKKLMEETKHWLYLGVLDTENKLTLSSPVLTNEYFDISQKLHTSINNTGFIFSISDNYATITTPVIGQHHFLPYFTTLLTDVTGFAFSVSNNTYNFAVGFGTGGSISIKRIQFRKTGSVYDIYIDTGLVTSTVLVTLSSHSTSDIYYCIQDNSLGVFLLYQNSIFIQKITTSNTEYNYILPFLKNNIGIYVSNTLLPSPNLVFYTLNYSHSLISDSFKSILERLNNWLYIGGNVKTPIIRKKIDKREIIHALKNTSYDVMTSVQNIGINEGIFNIRNDSASIKLISNVEHPMKPFYTHKTTNISNIRQRIFSELKLSNGSPTGLITIKEDYALIETNQDIGVTTYMQPLISINNTSVIGFSFTVNNYYSGSHPNVAKAQFSIGFGIDGDSTKSIVLNGSTEQVTINTGTTTANYNILIPAYFNQTSLNDIYYFVLNIVTKTFYIFQNNHLQFQITENDPVHKSTIYNNFINNLIDTQKNVCVHINGGIELLMYTKYVYEQRKTNFINQTTLENPRITVPDLGINTWLCGGGVDTYSLPSDNNPNVIGFAFSIQDDPTNIEIGIGTAVIQDVETTVENATLSILDEYASIKTEITTFEDNRITPNIVTNYTDVIGFAFTISSIGTNMSIGFGVDGSLSKKRIQMNKTGSIHKILINNGTIDQLVDYSPGPDPTYSTSDIYCCIQDNINESFTVYSTSSGITTKIADVTTSNSAYLELLSDFKQGINLYISGTVDILLLPIHDSYVISTTMQDLLFNINKWLYGYDTLISKNTLQHAQLAIETGSLTIDSVTKVKTTVVGNHRMTPIISISPLDIIAYAFNVIAVDTNMSIGIGFEGISGTKRIVMKKTGGVHNIEIYDGTSTATLTYTISDPTFSSTAKYVCVQNNVTQTFSVYENSVLITEVTTLTTEYNNLIIGDLQTSINLYIVDVITFNLLPFETSYLSSSTLLKPVLLTVTQWLFGGTTIENKNIGMEIKRVHNIHTTTQTNSGFTGKTDIIINDTVYLTSTVKGQHFMSPPVTVIKNDIVGFSWKLKNIPPNKNMSFGLGNNENLANIQIDLSNTVTYPLYYLSGTQNINYIVTPTFGVDDIYTFIQDNINGQFFIYENWTLIGYVGSDNANYHNGVDILWDDYKKSANIVLNDTLADGFFEIEILPFKTLYEYVGITNNFKSQLFKITQWLYAGTTTTTIPIGSTTQYSLDPNIELVNITDTLTTNNDTLTINDINATVVLGTSGNHRFEPIIPTNGSDIIGFGFTVINTGSNMAIGFGHDITSTKRIQMRKIGFIHDIIIYDGTNTSIAGYIIQPSFNSTDIYCCIQDNNANTFTVYENSILIAKITTLTTAYSNLNIDFETNINLYLSNELTVNILTLKNIYDNGTFAFQTILNSLTKWIYGGSRDSIFGSSITQYEQTNIEQGSLTIQNVNTYVQTNTTQNHRLTPVFISNTSDVIAFAFSVKTIGTNMSIGFGIDGIKSTKRIQMNKTGNTHNIIVNNGINIVSVAYSVSDPTYNSINTYCCIQDNTAGTFTVYETISGISTIIGIVTISTQEYNDLLFLLKQNINLYVSDETEILFLTLQNVYNSSGSNLQTVLFNLNKWIYAGSINTVTDFASNKRIQMKKIGSTQNIVIVNQGSASTENYFVGLEPNTNDPSNIFYCFQDNTNGIFSIYQNNTLIGQVTLENTKYNELLPYFRNKFNLYISNSASVIFYTAKYVFDKVSLQLQVDINSVTNWLYAGANSITPIMLIPINNTQHCLHDTILNGSDYTVSTYATGSQIPYELTPIDSNRHEFTGDTKYTTYIDNKISVISSTSITNGVVTNDNHVLNPKYYTNDNDIIGMAFSIKTASKNRSNFDTSHTYFSFGVGFCYDNQRNNSVQLWVDNTSNIQEPSLSLNTNNRVKYSLHICNDPNPYDTTRLTKHYMIPTFVDLQNRDYTEDIFYMFQDNKHGVIMIYQNDLLILKAKSSSNPYYAQIIPEFKKNISIIITGHPDLIFYTAPASYELGAQDVKVLINGCTKWLYIGGSNIQPIYKRKLTPEIIYNNTYINTTLLSNTDKILPDFSYVVMLIYLLLLEQSELNTKIDLNQFITNIVTTNSIIRDNGILDTLTKLSTIITNNTEKYLQQFFKLTSIGTSTNANLDARILDALSNYQGSGNSYTNMITQLKKQYGTANILKEPLTELLEINGYTKFLNNMYPDIDPKYNADVIYYTTTSTGKPNTNNTFEDIITRIIMDRKPKYAWAKKLGHRLIKSATIKINDQNIDTISDTLMNLEHKLIINTDTEKSYDEMIGNTKIIYEMTSLKPEKKLFIPFNFFFCKDVGNSLPLIALLHSNIELELMLNDISDILYIEPYTNYNKKPMIKYNLLAEYVYLDNDERLKMSESKLEYLIERNNYNGEVIIDGSKYFKNTNNILNKSHIQIIPYPKLTNKISNIKKILITSIEDHSYIIQNQDTNTGQTYISTSTLTNHPCEPNIVTSSTDVIGYAFIVTGYDILTGIGLGTKSLGNFTTNKLIITSSYIEIHNAYTSVIQNAYIKMPDFILGTNVYYCFKDNKNNTFKIYENNTLIGNVTVTEFDENINFMISNKANITILTLEYAYNIAQPETRIEIEKVTKWFYAGGTKLQHNYFPVKESFIDNIFEGGTPVYTSDIGNHTVTYPGGYPYTYDQIYIYPHFGNPYIIVAVDQTTANANYLGPFNTTLSTDIIGCMFTVNDNFSSPTSYNYSIGLTPYLSDTYIVLHKYSINPLSFKIFIRIGTYTELITIIEPVYETFVFIQNTKDGQFKLYNYDIATDNLILLATITSVNSFLYSINNYYFSFQISLLMTGQVDADFETPKIFNTAKPALKKLINTTTKWLHIGGLSVNTNDLLTMNNYLTFSSTTTHELIPYTSNLIGETELIGYIFRLNDTHTSPSVNMYSIGIRSSTSNSDFIMLKKTNNSPLTFVLSISNGTTTSDIALDMQPTITTFACFLDNSTQTFMIYSFNITTGESVLLKKIDREHTIFKTMRTIYTTAILYTSGIIDIYFYNKNVYKTAINPVKTLISTVNKWLSLGTFIDPEEFYTPSIRNVTVKSHNYIKNGTISNMTKDNITITTTSIGSHQLTSVVPTLNTSKLAFAFSIESALTNITDDAGVGLGVLGTSQSWGVLLRKNDVMIKTLTNETIAYDLIKPYTNNIFYCFQDNLTGTFTVYNNSQIVVQVNSTNTNYYDLLQEHYNFTCNLIIDGALTVKFYDIHYAYENASNNIKTIMDKQNIWLYADIPHFINTTNQLAIIEYEPTEVPINIRVKDPIKYFVWYIKFYDITTEEPIDILDWSTNGYKVRNSSGEIVNINPIIEGIQIKMLGVPRESIKSESYYTNVVPYCRHVGSLDTGEYLYSFSIKPNQLQPTGIANFSEIEDSTIIFQFTNQIETLMKQNHNIKAKVEIWGKSYNELRIMSGLAGLAFDH
jgi:hypothetical protein